MPTSSLCPTGARARSHSAADPKSPRSTSHAELAAWLQRTREEERAALARELHDELGSILTAARLDVAWLAAQSACQSPEITQRLRALQRVLEQGIQLKRRVVEQLHPTMLEHLGLAAAAEHLLSEHRARFAGVLDIHIDPRATLAGEGGLALYRILQEALTNAHKYAGAQRLTVRLRRLSDRVTLTIHDDGRGFDPDQVGWGHHGLAGMRQRMIAVEGQFEIDSAPGAGTLIRASVPLRSQQPFGAELMRRAPTRHTSHPAPA